MARIKSKETGRDTCSWLVVFGGGVVFVLVFFVNFTCYLNILVH